jgi:PGF-CTERM protein
VVEWYEGSRLLGKGKTFSIRNLREGGHTITCVVTDQSGASAETSVDLKIRKVDEGPGFGPVSTLVALGVLALLGASRGPRGGPS